MIFDKMTGDNARTRRFLDKVARKPPAFIAINDSLPDDADEKIQEAFEMLLHAFHETLWPEATPYELQPLQKE